MIRRRHAFGHLLGGAAVLLAAGAARALGGAHPGELAMEQPTTFEFVVDRRLARASGIAIPQSILLRADEVIE